MATNDLTQRRNFAEKKQVSTSCAELTWKDFNGTNKMTLFNLPPKSLIEFVMTDVTEAFDASATIKIEAGSDTVDTAASSTGLTTSTPKLNTGTGLSIYVTPGAEPTKGKIIIAVRYIEYTKGTRELTQYS